MEPLRLMAAFFKVGALNELQYRVNLILQLVESAIGLATGLVGLSLVFSHTETLAGWSRPELLAVMGVHILMGGIIQAVIQPNMMRIAEDVLEGTLDYALTKPVDAQALVSVREIRLWRLVNVALGLGVLGWALAELGWRVGPGAALAFGVALLLGAALIYSFWLILTTSAFWVVRIENIVNLFEGVFAAGRWPVGIYPPWLRGVLTFLVPVAFAVTVPAEALTERLDAGTLALAAGLALGALILARLLWRLGLRRYGGASA